MTDWRKAHGYKYRMKTYYRVRVNGRVFEDSKTAERAHELAIDILPRLYPDAVITSEVKREREYYKA